MLSTLPDPVQRPPAHSGARALYFQLLAGEAQADLRAGAFLAEQLEQARRLPCELPDDPNDLDDWLAAAHVATGQAYQAYLARRRDGAPREFFPGLGAARHFLRGVAPTKLVDGAWLYGLVEHWADPRFRRLIQTYLEELGEGRPGQNHVLLYRTLLASQGCDHWETLDDAHFLQGSLQLALAACTAEHLPEVIGFNLGYEQLPLHLPVTARELGELGIDPYYFTLHVTVDNAHSGHAHQAIRALRDAWPRLGDPRRFYRRLRDGYRLNALGKGSRQVIADYDPRAAVVRLLQDKSTAGRLLHGDHCRFEGRTVNQWLGRPEQVPGFLALLERRGWISHGRDPRHSRFWQLIAGERAPMAGVFDAGERQLIHDWIAGDWQPAEAPPRLPPRRSAAQAIAPPRHDDLDEEVRLLGQQLSALPTTEARLQRLVPLLAPAHHPTPAGLLATREFCRLFGSPAVHG